MKEVLTLITTADRLHTVSMDENICPSERFQKTPAYHARRFPTIKRL